MLVSTYRIVDIWWWDVMRSNCELKLIIYWIVRWNQFALIRLQSNYVQKNELILRSLDTLDSIGLAFSCADSLRECYTSHFSTKKKKTIEAKQIARLRIIEREVEQSKKDRVAKRQIIENVIEKSKKNLLDIDELNIISTIKNKIVKNLEKLSTNEIIKVDDEIYLYAMSTTNLLLLRHWAKSNDLHFQEFSLTIHFTHRDASTTITQQRITHINSSNTKTSTKLIRSHSCHYLLSL